MLEFIRIYQTVVVGVVGFLGVIISIIANGYFSRAQDVRKERREADALRIALIEELKQQKQALERTAESLKESAKDYAGNPKRGGMLPLDRYDAVFNVSINRVGILTDRQVAAVFMAYLPLRALTWKLRVLAAVDVGQNPAGAEEQVFLPGKALEVASQMHRALIPDIETAIAELGAKAKKRILKI